MKRKTSILGILIAVLALGIGYAAVTAVSLTINGEGTITPDENNFKVVYTAVEVTSKSDDSITTTQTTNDTKTASFTVSDMTKQGDSVTFTYTITNKSESLGASLGTPSISYDSTTDAEEYFTVTSPAPATTTLAAGGDATTTQTVTVTAKKTPIGTEDKTGKFTITLQATPINS